MGKEGVRVQFEKMDTFASDGLVLVKQLVQEARLGSMTRQTDEPGSHGRSDGSGRDRGEVRQELGAVRLPVERGYRCIAASVAGFIQQVAVSYIRTGHFFYVAGELKPDTDPAAVDAKLIHKYGVHATRWARALRKVRGEANLQYIRHGRFFLLMATHGRSLFFELEGENVKDCRRMPIKFAGYSLSHRNGHPHVRIDVATYLGFKASMADLALRLDKAGLEELLAMPRFVPYAPVRRQLLNVLREVNRVRAAAGLERVDERCLPLRRTIVRPFGDDEVAGVSSDEGQSAGWNDASLPVAPVRNSETGEEPGQQPGPRRPAGLPPGPRGDQQKEPQAGATVDREGLVSRPSVFPAEWSEEPEPSETTSPTNSTEGMAPGGPERPRGMGR